jgi:hypothetical protein
MPDNKIFANGIIYKAPRENAPDFVKGTLSIKTEEFTRFLEDHTKPTGWVNLVVKEGRSGKLYVELDQWVPQQQQEDDEADQIPF